MPNQAKPDTRILTPEEVDRIAARPSGGAEYTRVRTVEVSESERDALCQTLRSTQQYSLKGVNVVGES